MPKAKSPKKAALPLKDRAVRAALDLAVEQGWTAVTMDDIAKRCGCDAAEVQAIYRDKMAILIAYGQQLDKRIVDNVSVDPESPERDRLFDILMERFDILNEDRAAILSILSALRADPKQAFESLPHLGKSMATTLELAGVNSVGPCGATRIFGLTGVYLYTVRTWTDDKSADLSKTMASLDRALEKAEQMAGFLKL